MNAIYRELQTAMGLASCRGDEDKIKEAQRELVELSADAARYRWLRRQQIDLKAPALGVLNHGVFIGKIPDNVVLSEADADAAIDAAMAR